MKKRIVALGLALASSIALAQAQAQAQAQEKGGPQGGAAGVGQAVQMQEELGLTDEQVVKIREIREQGGSPQDVRDVLTPEQQAKAAQLRQEHRGGNVQRMKKRLGLSDEQVAKIKEIQKDGGSREDILAVLTPEQQANFDKVRGKNREKSPQTEK